MPYYVVNSVGHIPGISGVFVAGIFSASLSSVSAALNSLAAVTIEDYYKVFTHFLVVTSFKLSAQPLYRHIHRREASEKSVSLITKLAAFSYGILCVTIAFMVQFLGGLLQASLTIFGIVGGPLLALFSLGMFTVKANQKVLEVLLKYSISMSKPF